MSRGLLHPSTSSWGHAISEMPRCVQSDREVPPGLIDHSKIRRSYATTQPPLLRSGGESGV